jgi:phosphotransferase system enzyme I (PtsI)
MKITGTGIGTRIAIGPIVRMPDPLPDPPSGPSSLGADAELARAEHSLSAVAEELTERGAQAGGQAQEVLLAQAQMAADPALGSDIEKRLQTGITAERAVFEAFAAFRELLAGMGGYMAERATDLDDISQRVRAHLQELPPPGVPSPDFPFVLLATDLAPADTALLDLDKVLGLVTVEGGPTSHTAILAREKAIPALVGARDAAQLRDGQRVILDAARDALIVGPHEAQLLDAEQRIAAAARRITAALSHGALADGTPVPLLANLGSPEGIAKAVEQGAEGVGLFRTEFMFLDATRAPSVAEQQEQYRTLLAGFPGKKVVVRLLDAGADKPLSFLNDAPEENPALGVRGLRALQAHENVLRDQLTALAAADAETDADLWVMAPMVATVEETAYFTGLAHEMGIKTAGVMIEVPSAALLARRVLRVADFGSIGTNDLTQYAMAADRLLGAVSHLQSPWHPAVLKLVSMVGKAGQTVGKPIGICGEAAADPLLAVVLVGLGATSLSMSPSALAEVRAELANHTLAGAQTLARLALDTSDADEAKAAVRSAISHTQ